MKRTVAGLAGAVIAFASMNAVAQGTDTDTGAMEQDTGSMGSDTGSMGSDTGSWGSDTKQQGTKPKTGASAQQNQQTMPVAGVVTNVDKKANTLTIVAPAGGEVDIAQYGQALVVEREMNLVSLKAPLGQGAALLRDGKSVKIADIKEGDVVRTNFDPNAMSFTSVTAVSQKQIDKDIKGAQKELKRDIKTMEKAGKQMQQ